MSQRVKVVENIMGANEQLAAENRARLDAAGVFAVNLMASPGAGKTSLIERTVPRLAESMRVGVIGGDIATTLDAERAIEAGAIAVQITTGGACHLDAPMVRGAPATPPRRDRPAGGRERRQPDLPDELRPGHARQRARGLGARGGRQAVQASAHLPRRGRARGQQDRPPPVRRLRPGALPRGVRSLNEGLETFELSCRTGDGIEPDRLDRWILAASTAPLRRCETLLTSLSARLHVTGVVQGVGFRPYVWTLAHRLRSPAGCATARPGVDIAVEGADEDVGRFLDGASPGGPPRARIDAVEATRRRRRRRTELRDPRVEGRARRACLPVSARPRDVRRLPAARLRDPADRRYRYPFINCTNCGPRFTHRRATSPTTGPNTTMAALRDVRRLPPGVRRPAGPALPRPARGLPATCGPRVWLGGATAARVAERDEAAGAGRRRLLRRRRSWRSRASAASTWPATRRARPRSAGCASASTATRSRSR